MVVDLKRMRTVTELINIMGEKVGIFKHLKYLGAGGRGVEWADLLRKLRFLNVCNKMLRRFGH